MANVPPPYAPREHAQVQPNLAPALTPNTNNLEFAETASVCLEWKLSGTRGMYDSSKGEAKSKCIKSAVFGDPDNLWEVLWYPNSGVAGGEFASLYLSCVPTPYEREQGIGTKWTRKGLWWFRFEIRSSIPDDRTGKPIILATKDASDHTFAVKTANWGWQQFAKRDGLFLHEKVLAADSFTIMCTISSQPQPPAGYWLGIGLPPTKDITPLTMIGGRAVGSGGGLSAWSGGEGASGGVAGGTNAGGGQKRVVPKRLVSAVGDLLDDPLYSDIEFIIPHRPMKRREPGGSTKRLPPRKIYANKKLLRHCEYFNDMFTGGFMEVEGVIEEEDYDDDDLDTLSDSDMEEESTEAAPRPLSGDLQSLSLQRRASTSADSPHVPVDEDMEDESPESPQSNDGPNTSGAQDLETFETEEDSSSMRTAKASPKVSTASQSGSGNVGGRARLYDKDDESRLIGPKKTKVMVRDAAWSTWWAVLYWLYTDTIYFAPLTSSFDHPVPRSRPASISISGVPPPPEPRTRREWISQWLNDHQIDPPESLSSGGGSIPQANNSSFSTNPLGPRPVSAKAVYRLADKLDLPTLKLRAFQHIISGLTSGNIPAEVFSRFSSTFEDVRKVQVAFFLKHWAEIKKSETMMQIWQQIRLGKHVGFEEVWPLIVGQLDFKPS